jgi:hypothetical protein
VHGIPLQYILELINQIKVVLVDLASLIVFVAVLVRLVIRELR